MTFPTITSFFTDTWQYKKHSDRLKRECDALRLPHHIKELPATGEWLKNTRMKAGFINSAMIELNTPLLWIDVDGSIYKKPEFLLNATEDFIGRHQRTGPRNTWHVGTMFFNNTEKSKELLSTWAEQCKIVTSSDEVAFELAWKMVGDTLTYKELPEQYFLIMNGGVERRHDTVIAHRLSQCDSKLEMKRRHAASQQR